MNRRMFGNISRESTEFVQDVRDAATSAVSAAAEAGEDTYQKASVASTGAYERAGDAATTLVDDGKELADKAYAYANRTIRENPTLVIAGLVAVGAIGAMALKSRHSDPKYMTRMKRDIAKQTRALRHAIRDEMRASGATERFSEISRNLAAVDWRPYLQPIVDQAASLAKQASDKASSMTK